MASKSEIRCAWDFKPAPCLWIDSAHVRAGVRPVGDEVAASRLSRYRVRGRRAALKSLQVNVAGRAREAGLRGRCRWHPRRAVDRGRSLASDGTVGERQAERGPAGGAGRRPQP